jgi:phage gp16-like protein
MSIDLKKMKPEELQKLAEAAKKDGSKGAKAATDKAKLSSETLAKDSKILLELAKKNPDV